MGRNENRKTFLFQLYYKNTNHKFPLVQTLGELVFESRLGIHYFQSEMGLQSWPILLLITDSLTVKCIPNPRHFPQARYLFLSSSVLSSSPLGPVASQSQENANTLNFTRPAHEEKKSTAFPTLFPQERRKNSFCPRPMSDSIPIHPQYRYFPFILLPVFITPCISSFSLVCLCSTFLHTKNNVFLTPYKKD